MRQGPPVEERVECWPAVVAEAGHFAVEHGCRRPHGPPELGTEGSEGLVGVAVARDEPRGPVLDVGERPEAVELQLVDPLGVVEGLTATAKRHRNDGEGKDRSNAAMLIGEKS